MTLAAILAFLPEVTISDLRELVAPGILPENLRHYLQAEIQRRLQKPREKAESPLTEAGGENVSEGNAASDDDAERSGSGSTGAG
jgi:hypothetical protein